MKWRLPPRRRQPEPDQPQPEQPDPRLTVPWDCGLCGEEFPVVDGVTVLWDGCVVLACPDCGARIPRRSKDGWETVLVLPRPDEDVAVVDGLDPQPDTVPCAACLKRVPLSDAKAADVSMGRGSVLCPSCDAALHDVVSTALEIGG